MGERECVCLWKFLPRKNLRMSAVPKRVVNDKSNEHFRHVHQFSLQGLLQAEAQVGDKVRTWIVSTLDWFDAWAQEDWFITRSARDVTVRPVWGGKSEIWLKFEIVHRADVTCLRARVPFFLYSARVQTFVWFGKAWSMRVWTGNWRSLDVASSDESHTSILPASRMLHFLYT